MFFHEIFVARDINNPKAKLLAVRLFETEFGEAEINRNASGFFVRQSVRIGSGKRFNKSTLPVIDVSGGREHKI